MAKWGGVGCAIAVAGCFTMAIASASGLFGGFLTFVLAAVTLALASGKIGNPRQYALAPAGLAMAALFGTFVGVMSRITQEEQQQRVAQTQRLQVAAAAARADAVRADAGSILAQARGQLEQARAANVEARYGDATMLAMQARTTMQEVVALQPPVEGARELDVEAQQLLAQAQQSQAAAAAEAARIGAEAAAITRIEQALADATAVVAQSPGDDVIAYDGRLEALETTLRQAPPGARDRLARDIDRRIAAIGRRRSGIRRQVERAERELAEQAAYRLLCGDRPMIGAWDGELVGAERVLAETAHDPDSIDVENCTEPVLTREECWMTTCQVRGANAFGALVLNRVRFFVGARNTILSYRQL